MDSNQEAIKRLGSVSDLREPRAVDHYLYFAQQSNAENAASILRARGFSTTVRPGADKESWLVLATNRMILTEGNLQTIDLDLQNLADDHNGEYDGWEAHV